MHLSLRTKLTLIVGATALSLSSVIALSLQLGAQQSRDLLELEQRLVPKLELETKLMSQFEQLGRALEDSVAAQDPAALAATDEQREALYDVIARAGPALEPGASEALRGAIGRYHRLALHVSGRLMRGDGGEALVEEIAALQVEHRRTVEAIERHARLDRATLRSGFEAVHAASRRAVRVSAALGLLSLALIVGLSSWLGRGALRSLARIRRGFERFAAGRLGEPIEAPDDDELGALAREANRMASALERLARQRDHADWIKAGQVELAEKLRGEPSPEQAARDAIELLTRRVGAQAGALYLEQRDGSFELCASYAFPEAAASGRAFVLGQGLVGQAALEDGVRVVDDVPAGYLDVRSGLGQAAPRCLALVPLRRGARAVGVVELAFFGACSEASRELLGLVSEGLAVTLDSARSRARLGDLLEESQTLAARLASQEDELVRSNQELSAQKEELRHANEALESQRTSLRLRNSELEQARAGLQAQADQLTQMSTYKSQFLANMSHELRTPLNSMLLLSQILAGNEAGNLSVKQVEHCRAIYRAGKGLLSLINQVLDLSKIEAGKQQLDVSDVALRELCQHLRATFEPQLEGKGLEFALSVAPDVPQVIQTDGACLQRILINLLGNALKFTERGSVALTIARPSPEMPWERADLPRERAVAFSVRDTGIGIPAAFQSRLFSRFEQGDARTVRRYGGTGLGLAIARECAQLLGGELRVESVAGEGSTFTCILPERLSPRAEDQLAESKPLATKDAREALGDGDPYVLIVEDDPLFAEQLLATVRGLGLEGVVAGCGKDALRLARGRPPAGIVLDVMLPDIDGFTVRGELAKDPRTEGVPVHFVSALEAPAGLASQRAVGYLTKPASGEALTSVIQALTRQGSEERALVLLVEDDEEQARSVLAQLAASRFETRHVRSAERALEALEDERFGCMILDLGLPDLDGLALLERLGARDDIRLPPVVVHTARALSAEERRRLGGYTSAVISKDAQSVERVAEEARAFLGRLQVLQKGDDPPPLPAAGAGVALDGAKVLIADDDMRTVYALSALLRERGADVIVAETGREALRALDEHGDVHAVLMDVMLPDMDGYEAMRSLRRQPRFARLPVIALTASALQGEKERCEAAGASEHMTKPVDPTGLLSSLGHWLERPAAQSGMS